MPEVLSCDNTESLTEGGGGIENSVGQGYAFMLMCSLFAALALNVGLILYYSFTRPFA
jgi:hypothetical protein